MLIDSHAHIHFKDFQGEIPALLKRAQEAGVELMINVGTDLENSRESIRLAEENPQIFATVAVHPHDVAKISDEDLNTLRDLAKHPRVVAIGEVGLDYYYEHSPKEIQQKRLADFIRIAKEVGKPLVIHCRDAFEDCFRILDQEGGWNGGGVFHCFTGDWPTAQKVLKKGFYISFSGIVTFKKATTLHEVAKQCPADRFLIETDCPYLTPEPHRGKRNEPAYVRLVAEKIASLRGEATETIGYITAENTRRLFHLPDHME